jgi:hypothetical protein
MPWGKPQGGLLDKHPPGFVLPVEFDPEEIGISQQLIYRDVIL